MLAIKYHLPHRNVEKTNKFRISNISNLVEFTSTMSSARKESHVASEKKRREAIRKGFDNLTMVLPNLDVRHARSEAIVIEKSVEFLRLLEQENASLKNLASQNGIDL